MLKTLQEGADRFYPGAAVEVYGTENNLIFLGKIDRVGEETIEIVEANGRYVPQVIYNTEIKVVSVASREEIAVLFGKVCGSTADMWKLDRLRFFCEQERRVYYRQKIDAGALVRRLADGEYTEEVVCKILDVSMGGVQFRCRETFHVGDRLLLTMPHLAAEEEPFILTCRIRREGGEYTYGCEFEKVPAREHERLFRAILSAQRKEIQKRRAR